MSIDEGGLAITGAAELRTSVCSYNVITPLCTRIKFPQRDERKFASRSNFLANASDHAANTKTASTAAIFGTAICIAESTFVSDSAVSEIAFITP